MRWLPLLLLPLTFPLWPSRSGFVPCWNSATPTRLCRWRSKPSARIPSRKTSDCWASASTSAGASKEGQQAYESAIAAQKQSLGPEHVQVALTLNQWGGVAYRCRDYSGAENAYRRAAAILEGQPDANLASVFDSLGLVLTAQHRPTEALPFFQQALVLREQSLGASHPLVADTLTHMGLVDPDHAAQDYQKALTILEKSMGPQDPSLVGLLDRMGRFYEDSGDLDNAFKVYQRALPLLRAQPDQQDFLAATLLGLGQLQLRRGQLTEADSSLSEAARLWTGLYGQKYARLGLVRANQAALWQQGDYPRAERGYQEALGLRRGFARAGAENLLLTLWPIADQETAEGSTVKAARLAGPFVLTFKGKPR